MKRLLEAVILATLLLSAREAHGTASTVVWTPATTYTQPFLVPHVTYDTYLGERTILQETWGLTVGVVPPNRWLEAEVGADLMYPLLPTANAGTGATYAPRTAVMLNAKLSLKEGALAANVPGLSAGVYGLGFTKDTTDYDIFYAVLGKTIGRLGTLAAGGYVGNDRVLVKLDPATGAPRKDAAGFLASYTTPQLPLDRVGLKGISGLVDWQSGRSAFGALGAAVLLAFTDSISLLTGPVLFNDRYALSSVNQARTLPAAADQGRLVWTLQLDVDVDLARPKPAPGP